MEDTGHQSHQTGRCFSVEEARLRAGDLVELPGTPRDTVGSVTGVVEGDHRFLQAQGGEVGNRHHMSRRALHHWFVHLNIRLARARVAVVGESQLTSLASSLGEGGSWCAAMPVNCLAYGHSTGLICRSLDTGEFVFPLALILSFMSGSNVHVAEEHLLALYDVNRDASSSSEGLTEALERLLRGFSRRQQDVIAGRNSLFHGRRLTLEELGGKWGVTRERIRQVERGCWRTLSHAMSSRHMVAPLLSYIMARKGSLAVIDTEAPEVRFMAKCLGVSMAGLPDTGFHILGMAGETLGRLEPHPWYVYDINALAGELQSRYGLVLGRDDLLKVTAALSSTLKRRMTKSQKVYASLRQTGKPEHYERIFKMYQTLFPADGMTAHDVHKVLGRHKHGVVWIGRRGTYALREWGYERPSNSPHPASARRTACGTTEVRKPQP